MLQKLEKSIDELEGKLNAAVNEIEKKVDGETTTPSSGKPLRYPFPWPQKASTSGSYRLRLRFVKFYPRGASVTKWAEFKKQAKEEKKNRKEAADTSSVANENVDVNTDAENNNE